MLLAESCPATVRKACSELLPGVDAATPRVTIAAKDAQGNDTLDVRVVVDGAPFADRLVAAAVPIDPGEHAVIFEAPDGTRFPITFSAGVAALDAPRMDLESWRSAADRALYDAKSAGRRCIRSAAGTV